MMKKNQVVSQDHHQDMKKKILYLKKIERWQKEKKNPKTNFRRQNFSMFVKINKAKNMYDLFEVITTTTT